MHVNRDVGVLVRLEKLATTGVITLSLLYFHVLEAIAGAKIVDIARFGDELIEQRTNAIYKNKNKAGKVVSRGVAFPVCISVNETVCHCSPLETDTEVCTLQCVAVFVPRVCILYESTGASGKHRSTRKCHNVSKCIR